MIIVRTDSVNESNMSAIISVRCAGLKSKKGFMGLVAHNQPFLVIKRCMSHHNTDHDSAVKVFSSEAIHDTLKPSWNLGEFKLENLCNSDIDLPLIFEVWSYQSSGDHRIYGRVTGSVRQLLDQQGCELDIIKKQGNAFGTMTFDKFQLIERPSMMDYLRSGWVISLSVAVDFTASNGELSESTSLHYIDPHNPNIMTAYEQAIFQVGKILEPYDYDKQFPVYGFGAKPRFMGLDEVSHCFHLNGQANPCVVGVNGILESYRYKIHSLKLIILYILSVNLILFSKLVVYLR
jgi:hypothetical protein